MSTRLEPPPPRDMPADRRREIRAALVSASHRRRHPQRWLVALPVAVLALLLAIALAQPWTLGAPDVGVPAASPSGPTDPGPAPGRTTESPTPSSTVPAARPVDEGPLTEDASARAVSRCLADLGRSTTARTVHLARRTSTSGDVVLFTARDGRSYSCSSREGASVYDGPGSKALPLPEPDAEHPAVRVDGDGLSTSAGRGRVRATTSASYRVTDEVASLQYRLIVDGHTGSWFEASRSGGWAWAAADVEYEGGLDPRAGDAYRIDVRAFDSDGKRLEVDRTPR